MRPLPVLVLVCALLVDNGAAALSPVDVGDQRVTARGSTTARSLKDRFADIINVKDFGAKGDGVTNDSTAIQAAARAAAVSGAELHFPAGTYEITPIDGTPFTSWTATRNVRITGAGAVLSDRTAYTRDVLTPIFLFDGCHNVEVTGIEYVGTPLPTPAQHLGYRGATFVRAINGTTNVRVRAKVQHARYGVQSGDYADETKGNCRVLNVELVTYRVGYPLAVYLAEDVDASIYAEDVHRAVYLAGVLGGRIKARFKNQYIADTFVLLTNAKSGPHTSRGCSDVDVEAQDVGSTVFQRSSMATGINLSRVDPGTVFSDLRFRFHVVGTDRVATTVGGFRIASDASRFGYPFNWEPTIHLNNIRVSGTIDRSAQTLDASPAGDIYVHTHDSGHSATVRNLYFDGISIIPSSRYTKDVVVEVPGIQDRVTFTRYTTPGVGLRLATSESVPAVFTDSIVGAVVLGGTARISLQNTSVASLPDALTGQLPSANATIASGGALLRMKQATLTLTGTSVDWSAAIPAGALVLGVSGVVTRPITGTHGYEVGVPGALGRFADVADTAAGTSFTPAHVQQAEVSPRYYRTPTPITVTAKSGAFTAGTLRLLLTYVDFLPPTN